MEEEERTREGKETALGTGTDTGRWRGQWWQPSDGARGKCGGVHPSLLCTGASVAIRAEGETVSGRSR